MLFKYSQISSSKNAQLETVEAPRAIPLTSWSNADWRLLGEPIRRGKDVERLSDCCRPVVGNVTLAGCDRRSRQHTNARSTCNR